MATNDRIMKITCQVHECEVGKTDYAEGSVFKGCPCAGKQVDRFLEMSLPVDALVLLDGRRGCSRKLGVGVGIGTG